MTTVPFSDVLPGPLRRGAGTAGVLACYVPQRTCE